MTSDRSNGSESTEVAPSAAVPVKTLNPDAHEFQSQNPPAVLPAAVAAAASSPDSALLQLPASGNEDSVDGPGEAGAEEEGAEASNMVLPEATHAAADGYPFMNGDGGEAAMYHPQGQEADGGPEYVTMNGGAAAMEPQHVYEQPADDGSSATALEMELSEEHLHEALKHQLEFYFSPQNLGSDSYLCSQMDEDKFVSIAIIANFPKVLNLTKDLSKVVATLRASSLVQVDDAGEKVRAVTKRCVVILREIPESTPKEDVMKLFQHKDCPQYTGCEFVQNDNWYVTFETEEEAQAAYSYLRETAKTFLGKPIKARIKAKPLVPTYNKNGYKGQQPAPVTPPVFDQQPAPQQPQQVAPAQMWFSSASLQSPILPPSPMLAPISRPQPSVVTSTYAPHSPIVSAQALPTAPISIHHTQHGTYCTQPGFSGAVPFFPPTPQHHVSAPHMFAGNSTFMFDPGAYPYYNHPSQVFAANGYTPTFRVQTSNGNKHHPHPTYHNVRQAQQRQDSRNRPHRYNQQQVSGNQSGGNSHHHNHHHGGSSLGGSHRDHHPHHHNHHYGDGPHRGSSHRPPRHRGGGGSSSSSSAVSTAVAAAAAATHTEPTAQPSAAPTATASRASAAASSSVSATATPTAAAAIAASSGPAAAAASVTPSTATTSASAAAASSAAAADNCHTRLNASATATLSSPASQPPPESNSRDPAAQPQRTQRNFRNGGRRRRGPDEDGARGGPRQSGGQQSERGQNSRQEPTPTPVPRQTFELDDKLFPPLPGSTSNSSTNEVFENKMSDVVSGKAKPLTREPKAIAATTTTSSSSASPVSTSQVTETSPPRSPQPAAQPAPQSAAQPAAKPAAQPAAAKPAPQPAAQPATQQAQKAGKSPTPELPWSKPLQLTTPPSQPTQATAAAATVEKSAQSTPNAQTPKTSSQPAADKTDSAMDMPVSSSSPPAAVTPTASAASEQPAPAAAPAVPKMSYALIVAKPKESAPGDNNASGGGTDNHKKAAAAVEENHTDAPAASAPAAGAEPAYRPRDNPHPRRGRGGGGRGGSGRQPMYQNGPRRPGPRDGPRDGPREFRDGPMATNGSRK